MQEAAILESAALGRRTLLLVRPSSTGNGLARQVAREQQAAERRMAEIRAHTEAHGYRTRDDREFSFDAHRGGF